MASNFPGQIDNFILHRDIGFTDIASLNRYNELKLRSSLTEIERNELMSLTAQLRHAIFVANDFNHVQDAVVETQKFAKNGIDAYVDNRIAELNYQGATWQNQMNSQQNSFNTWFNNIQNNMVTIPSVYDFDNLLALAGGTPGTTYTWTDMLISPITETIRTTGTSGNTGRIAVRTTTYLNNNINSDVITVDEVVYASNGTTEIRRRKATFNLSNTSQTTPIGSVAARTGVVT